MRFAVESWAPEYGTPGDAETLEPSSAQVEYGSEVPAESWTPRGPPDGAPEPPVLLFVDGVRRIDARVWIHAPDGSVRPGICASYAAGWVRCDGAAELGEIHVQRGMFTPAPDAGPIATRHATYPARPANGDTAEQLTLALQVRMGELEVRLAHEAGPAGLVVIDGPLRGRQDVPNAIGYVKSHQVAYLAPVVADTVARLAAGERTPLFLMTTSWSRYSWYLRLPGAWGHPWAGIVRCEASSDLPAAEAARLADASAAVLPRFASSEYKDPRAPQNLVPVGALERRLRHRLGDQMLLYRSLRAASLGVA